MAYSKTEKTDNGNRADVMDAATRIPGAPAVVKNRNKHTVPKISQVDFKPLGSHLLHFNGRLGPMIPAIMTANSVTTGMWADGLWRSLLAINFPNHSNVEAEKKAKDMDSAVILGVSVDSVACAVDGCVSSG